MEGLKQVFELTLAKGSRLRVRDSAGTRLSVRSGRVWVTEEGVQQDHVLHADEARALAQPGVTLIEAVDRSRIALATPHGVETPHVVELAFDDCEPVVATAAAPLAGRPPIPRPARCRRYAGLPFRDARASGRARQAANPFLQWT